MNIIPSQSETRVGGEWFDPSDELADYIEEHAA